MILIAIWFGLVTGLVEVGILALEKRYLSPIMQLSRQFVWMAPLVEVMLLLLSALIVAVGGQIWRRINPLPLVLFVSSLVAVLNLLMLVPGLHHVAALVLAAGFGIQASRFIVAHSVSFHVLVRRTIPWMIGFVIILGLSVEGIQLLAERRALAQLSPRPTNAANVLFIVLDTVRASHLSLYGYDRGTTPQLERLARRGVVFKRALATASWTLPSHASMFTGRFPHEVSTDWEVVLDNTHSTLAEFLSKAGYYAAGFVANTHYCSYETGLNRGFAIYRDYRISFGQIVASSTLTRTIADNFRIRWILRNDELLNRQRADQINRDFLRWLSGIEGRPFFAFLNYYDAHSPYLPPTPYDKKFGPERRNGKISPRQRIWLSPGELSPEEIQEEIDAYDGSIAYLDHQLGLLFEDLEKRGVLRNTLVIITSDHGEEFGAHRISGYGRIFGHGKSLYLSELNVPLVILFESHIPNGMVVYDPVTLRDLPATVMDLLNLEARSHFPGNSLARYWRTTTDDLRSKAISPLLSELTKIRNLPSWYPVSKGDMKSVVSEGMHYVKNSDGSEELYDFETDVAEERNLANAEDGQRVLVRFRSLLDQALAYKRYEKPHRADSATGRVYFDKSTAESHDLNQ